MVNYDIFTISETWLDPSVCDSDLNIPGYILTRQDRGPQKKGGGLIVDAKTSSKSVCLILGLLYPNTTFRVMA